MTLPRRLTLTSADVLGIEPVKAVESLRCKHQQMEAMTLPANQEVVLDGVIGNTMEIMAEIDPRGAPMVELDVLRSPGGEERTRIVFYPGRGYANVGIEYGGGSCSSAISIDTSCSSTAADVQSRVPETAYVVLEKDEPLKLRVFIDRSVIEVFANGRQCIAVRVYPDHADSVGVSLRAQGRDAELKSFDVWQMKSIY